MKKIAIFLIVAYKKYISPLLGNNCRFFPTCSEYGIKCMEVHGFFKGGILLFGRIMRCNPFCKAGYDPPPEKGFWKNPNRRTWREKAH